MTQNLSIEQRLAGLNEQELRRLLIEQHASQRLGLNWEHDLIARDRALNADVVLPRLDPALSCQGGGASGEPYRNLIIEGDNFDSLRLLKATHAGKIRVIYIDPPYNTDNKDWVYNDKFVGKNARWRHSQWLEFLYQRLTLARDLLTSDGVILVSINDENRARLELLMDEVFPGMRIGSLVWRTRDTTSAKDKNFSDVHEHILVYGGSGFAFNGRDKTPQKYKNPDNDPRGLWNGDPLTLAFDRFERENLYYPLQNPLTGRWYPCDENRVWAYATEINLKDGQKLQAETMEEFVRRKQILFPLEEKVVVWNSVGEILRAIDSGDVPVTPKRKRPLLSANTPNLEFWVGKPVGFGRPLFKKFWKDLRSHTNPVSSWISRINEIYEEDDLIVMRSPQAGQGTEQIQEIFGSKVFQYPKPGGLILELLRQSTRPNDIVLDFFAGSGTTGQAVLELNVEDGGQRRFILCSSTEATAREQDKNLCRDVCAGRMHRVIAGYADKPGYPVAQGGNFAYLQLDKYDPADAQLDASHDNALQLLAMRYAQVALPPQNGPLKIVAVDGDLAVVYLEAVSQPVIEALIALPYSRLAVYSARPATVAEKLAESGKSGNCYSIADGLVLGQAGERS